MLSGLFEAARASLALFIEEQRRVQVVMRRDPKSRLEARIVEGILVGIGRGADGRERAIVRVSDGTEVLLLVERIAGVAPVE